tara:strand:+ start:317 stop:742 length:426 start_codon:yes stop_codon:yes gene_type:complete
MSDEPKMETADDFLKQMIKSGTAPRQTREFCLNKSFEQDTPTKYLLLWLEAVSDWHYTNTVEERLLRKIHRRFPGIGLDKKQSQCNACGGTGVRTRQWGTNPSFQINCRACHKTGKINQWKYDGKYKLDDVPETYADPFDQ